MIITPDNTKIENLVSEINKFNFSIFCAGGISNCTDWQSKYIELLNSSDVLIVNPRRINFNILNTELAKEQITWEKVGLLSCLCTSFWFCAETLCPITLFELGNQLSRKIINKLKITDKPIFVGCDPLYQRKFDVEVQVSLYRPDVKIVYSIEDLVKSIQTWRSNVTI